MATSFAFALETVPTHHMEECFRRAIQTNTSDFPITAAAVTRAYEDYKPELLAQARTASVAEEYRLRSGQGSLEYMSVEEFKLRHNLPIVWRLGDAYPPESDLYNAPVPVTPEQTHNCQRCKDARHLKDYPPGPDGKIHPYVVDCPECGA